MLAAPVHSFANNSEIRRNNPSNWVCPINGCSTASWLGCSRAKWTKSSNWCQFLSDKILRRYLLSISLTHFSFLKIWGGAK